MVNGDVVKYQNEEPDREKKNINKKLFWPKKGVEVTVFHFLKCCLNLPRYIRSKTEAAFDLRWGGGGEGTPQLQKEVTDTDGGGKIEVGERDFTSNALKLPTFAYFLHGLGNKILLSLLAPVEYALILIIKAVSLNIIV